ncbi:MAG TPA: YigZ family protein [Anaerolineae bacterium]
MKGYPIPAQETHAETVVVNSRFICTIAEARSTDEATAFIRRVKERYHDASSHAYAFHIGFGASITDGCNDGGEPSGTAGRPMLAVLQGSGLGDVAAVVSRWFGGTKLGTGGLVRAFSGALKAALEVLPRTERVERKTFLLDVPYPLYERVKLLVAARGGALAGEEFGVSVVLTLVFAVDDVEPFRAALRDLSAGQLEMLDMSTD